jgi:hypothetical protein
MKANIYDELTYEGTVNRIRDGVSLSEHQKAVMAKCGLTIEDFKNQKSIEERCAIVNAHRMFERLKTNAPAN